MEVALVSRPTHAKPWPSFRPGSGDCSGTSARHAAGAPCSTEPNIRKSHWPREPTRRVNGIHGYRQLDQEDQAPVLESGRIRHATSPATIDDSGINVPITNCRVLETRADRSCPRQSTGRPSSRPRSSARPTTTQRRLPTHRAPASVPRRQIVLVHKHGHRSGIQPRAPFLCRRLEVSTIASSGRARAVPRRSRSRRGGEQHVKHQSPGRSFVSGDAAADTPSEASTMTSSPSACRRLPASRPKSGWSSTIRNAAHAPAHLSMREALGPQGDPGRAGFRVHRGVVCGAGTYFETIVRRLPQPAALRAARRREDLRCRAERYRCCFGSEAWRRKVRTACTRRLSSGSPGGRACGRCCGRGSRRSSG